MQCWKCKTNFEDFADGKVPFRSLCYQCSSALHCCRDCHYYKPGMPNDCLVPNTEWVSNREAANFCEEFKLKMPETSLPPPDDSKKKFNNLFKD